MEGGKAGRRGLKHTQTQLRTRVLVPGRAITIDLEPASSGVVFLFWHGILTGGRSGSARLHQEAFLGHWRRSVPGPDPESEAS